MEMPRNPDQNKIPRYWQMRKATKDREVSGGKIAAARWSDADWLVVEVEAAKIRAAGRAPSKRARK